MEKPKLLLLGSSIMEQWHKPETIFWGYTVVNRAVGGTTTTYWTHHVKEVLAEEHPDAVFAYVGSNDLVQPLPPKDIAKGVKRIRELISTYSKKLPFAYLAIIKAPQRLGRFHEIQATNHAIGEVLLPEDLWLESDPVFLNANGEPKHHLYVEDGLHLNPEAYRLLTRYLAPEIVSWLDLCQKKCRNT